MSSNPIKYADAVSRVRSRIKADKEGCAYFLRTDPLNDESVYQNILIKQTLSEGKFASHELMEASYTCPLSHDKLRFYLSFKLLHGQKLSPEESVWLGKLLVGDIPTPKGKSRTYTKMQGLREQGLHRFIVDAISYLVSRGMTATRNAASSPTCAADAVAQAIKEESGPVISYEGVRKIWLKSKPSREAAEREQSVLQEQRLARHVAALAEIEKLEASGVRREIWSGSEMPPSKTSS